MSTSAKNDAANELINVSFVFRHTESTDSLKNYAEEKLKNKISKYISGPVDLHIVLSVEKLEHMAEVHLTGSSIDTTAKATTEDMYSSIDKAAATLEKQLRKLKEKALTGRHQTPPEATSLV